MARSLEGSQTSPRRLKLREATSGRPLCIIAALSVSNGGSRERFDVQQFYGPLYPDKRTDAMGKTLRWVIPGSRLLVSCPIELPSCRAAPLQAVGIGRHVP
jgi:hypothetical protein